MFLTKGIETGNSEDIQLYNLKEDPSQQNNLASKLPKKSKEMMADFKNIVGDAYKNTSRLQFD